MTSAKGTIAFSVSHERDDALRVGLGLEHVSEMLRRLARPVAVSRNALAYAGNWSRRPGNFTRLFAEVVSAEQAELLADDDGQEVLPFYNHLAWPHYLDVDVRTEAEHIACCRIVRITQALADIPDDQRCPDAEAGSGSDRSVLCAARTLSAMRRIQVQGMPAQSTPYGRSPRLPETAARICIGGKLGGFSGFMPGLYEEVLYTLEAKRPLYLLGGFGGATAALTNAILRPGHDPAWCDVNALASREPGLARLNTLARGAASKDSHALFDELVSLLPSKSDLGALHTGLSPDETRMLMTSSDPEVVIGLTLDGLGSHGLIQR